MKTPAKHISQEHIPRLVPKNLVKDQESLFTRALKYRLPEPAFSTYPNALVTMDGVAFQHGKLVEESLLSANHVPWFKSPYVLLTKLLNKKKAFTEPSTVLAYNYYSEGYYHWITEVLSRLYVVKDLLPESTLILPSQWRDVYSRRQAIRSFLSNNRKSFNKDGFYLDSLQPFQVGNIEFIEEGKYAKVNNLVVPGFTATFGNYNPSVARGIGKLFRDYFNTESNKEFPERIYISRRNALHRKIENENDVEKVLAKYGFQRVCFEDYSFTDQVIMAANAKFLIGNHGAGLTNILFMKEGSSVMEISLEGDYYNYCFYSLANAIGVNYYYQMAPTRGDKGFHTANLFVDIKKLEKNVQAMLNNQQSDLSKSINDTL